MFPAEQKTLTVRAIRISQWEDGQSVSSSFEFYPGDTLFLRAEVTGYKPTEDGHVRLESEIAAADPEGVLLAEAVKGKTEAELAAEDKEWAPIVRATFLIPPTAPTGEYRISIRVSDPQARTVASAEAKFSVRGKALELGGPLATRNFRFLRTEEDGAALVPAAYRPGDVLWARFEITGFKLAEKHALAVDYGLAVYRASGEKLFEQAVAAEDKEASYYPKRYVPGIISLSLDKDIRPGEYTIALTARDRLGGQTAESRHVFRVE
jgi:hypothetical protein